MACKAVGFRRVSFSASSSSNVVVSDGSSNPVRTASPLEPTGEVARARPLSCPSLSACSRVLYSLISRPTRVARRIVAPTFIGRIDTARCVPEVREVRDVRCIEAMRTMRCLGGLAGCALRGCAVKKEAFRLLFEDSSPMVKERFIRLASAAWASSRLPVVRHRALPLLLPLWLSNDDDDNAALSSLRVLCRGDDGMGGSGGRAANPGGRFQVRSPVVELT